MSTEVEIDPSFQLQPDPKTVVPRSSASVEKTPKKKSLIGVFKRKNNLQYESIDDTPPTAPSTPDGPEIEIDLTVNVVSAATDPTFGFDSDDNDSLMRNEIPEIFPHQEDGLPSRDEHNQIVQPAQFKVPTQLEDVVVDDTAGTQQQQKQQAGNEQAKNDPENDIEAAHQQASLIPAHTNDSAEKNDGVFYGSLDGPNEDTAQPQSSDLAEECARHENFEVVLDPSYFKTPKKEFYYAVQEAALGSSAPVEKEVLDIQLDLEGFERQMQEESDEVYDQPDEVHNQPDEVHHQPEEVHHQSDEVLNRPDEIHDQPDEVHNQGMQQEENQQSGISPGASALPIAAAGVSQLPLENETESPTDTVEVSVEEPPEDKITVENNQPASMEETKPKKKKTPKTKLRSLAKMVKAKAMSSKASMKAKAKSSKASVKAISSRASKGLRSAPVSNKKEKEPNENERVSKEKEKQQIVAAEKPIKPKAVWRAVEDPKSGSYYYYHRTTRETTWTKPDEYAAYERAMEKYERDRAAYERYHEKTVEEVVISQIESRALSHEASADDDGRRNVPEENKGVADDNNTDADQGLEGVPFDEASSESEKPFDEVYDDKANESFDDKANEPFDESYDDKPNELLPVPVQGRTSSHFSTLTEQTHRINNISRGSGLDSCGIEESSGLGSLSNLDEDQMSFNSPLMRRARARSSRPSSSHRAREVEAEDLGRSRLAAEKLDRHGRTVKARGSPFDDERFSSSEQMPAAGFEQDDTASAMSEVDPDVQKRRDNFNMARRRALDDAIERKDATLFSALLIGMKASDNAMQETQPGWDQARVDRMIANDDWDHLKSYVAETRDQLPGTKSTPTQTAHINVPPVAVSPNRIGRRPSDSASACTDYSV